jgi:hypothetical protein
MAWKISQLSSSLMGLLREPEVETGSLERLQHIRTAMLDCIDQYLQTQDQRPPLCAKVMHAYDVQTLWYLRSEVMHLLSGYCGETLAAGHLSQITQLFAGHLPSAQFASAKRR